MALKNTHMGTTGLIIISIGNRWSPVERFPAGSTAGVGGEVEIVRRIPSAATEATVGEILGEDGLYRLASGAPPSGAVATSVY